MIPCSLDINFLWSTLAKASPAINYEAFAAALENRLPRSATDSGFSPNQTARKSFGSTQYRASFFFFLNKRRQLRRAAKQAVSVRKAKLNDYYYYYYYRRDSAIGAAFKHRFRGVAGVDG